MTIEQLKLARLRGIIMGRIGACERQLTAEDDFARGRLSALNDILDDMESLR